MKKNTTFPLSLRKVHAILLSLTLTLTSVPVPDAQAQISSDIAGMGIGALSSFGTAFVQSMQQTRFAQQAALMMAGLQPQVTRARFFPQCTTSVARQNFPAGACREITDPGALALAEGLAGLAENYDNFYAQLLSPAQNSPFPVGVQCLDENRKSVESELSEKLNSLTRLQSQLRKNNQLFRDANAQIEEQMKAIKGELDGTDGDTLAGQGRDLNQFFQDAACQEAMDQGALSEAKGLRGARALFTSGNPPLRTTAAQYLQDEGVIRQHLETQIERIVADIQRDGVDRWLATQGASLERARNGGLTSFEGLKAAIGNELQVFNAEKAQIQQELKAVGVTLPNFDQHFGSNVEGFKRNAGEFLRKRFVNDCVNGNDQTGVALSTDQILSGLRLQGSATGGTTITDFRLALGNILRSDAFIEDKMAQISALEQRVGGGQIKVEFVNDQAQRTFASPFELYRQTIDRCAARFETDDTFSPQASGGGEITADVTSRQSRREQLDRASRYLEDAKRLETGFISRITGSVRTRVLECGGGSSAGATRSGQCNSNAMSTSNTDFCINTATTCANNVQTCFAKVDQIVKQKEQQIQGHANTFNDNMRGLVARQEQVLQTIRSQVERDQQFLRRFFPGANFDLPADMFVAMPEMKDSEFGVQLLNGGNLDFLDNVAAKIDDMKASLEEQKGRVDESIKQYMNEQKTAMEQDRQRWNQLKSDCQAKAQQFRQQVAQRNDAGAKAQAEQGAKVQEFCFKYDRLRHTANPTGGCEGSNSPSTLMGEANRIAAHLDSTVVANLDEYARLCSQSNNHSNSENGDDDDDDDTPADPMLQRVCEAGGIPDGLSVIERDISRNMPTSLRSHRNAIMNYIRGRGSDSTVEDIEGFKSGPMREAADDLRRLRGRGGDRSDDEPRAPAATPPAVNPETVSLARTTLNTHFTTATGGNNGSINITNCSGLTPNTGTVSTILGTVVPEALRTGTGDAAATSPTHAAIDQMKANVTLLRTCANTQRDSELAALPALVANPPTVTADQVSARAAQRTAITDRYTALGTALDSLSTQGLTPLDTALHPAAPPSSTGAGGELCNAVRSQATTASAECANASTTTTGETQTACRARFLRDAFRSPENAEARRIARTLASASEAFRSGGGDDADDRTLETWSAIGERGAGSCAALASGARAGSAMGSFLQNFDAQTIGAGATGR